MEYLDINGITVELERKPIKNIYLSVRPPEGKVHLSVPRRLSVAAAREYLDAKWRWIVTHRDKVISRAAARPEPRYVSGETFRILGEDLVLRVNDCPHGSESISVADGELVLNMPATAGVEQRKFVLETWAELKLVSLIGALMGKWTGTLGESGVSWNIQRMKTLWGSCHLRTRSITFNSRLYAAPKECVEYVVVHELTHFRVPDHGPRFKALMNERLPQWPALRRRLNGKQ